MEKLKKKYEELKAKKGARLKESKSGRRLGPRRRRKSANAVTRSYDISNLNKKPRQDRLREKPSDPGQFRIRPFARRQRSVEGLRRGKRRSLSKRELYLKKKAESRRRFVTPNPARGGGEAALPLAKKPSYKEIFPFNRHHKYVSERRKQEEALNNVIGASKPRLRRGSGSRNGSLQRAGRRYSSKELRASRERSKRGASREREVLGNRLN